MPSRLHVLFVCEKWAECDPAHGLSNAHTNFIGSFRAAGMGSYDCFFYDEHAWRTGARCDDALIETARRLSPDIVFVTPVRGSDLNPATETLARLRGRDGPLLVMLNGDTCDAAGVAWCERFAPVVDLVIVQDCYSFYPSRVRDKAKYLDAWTPQDPTVFHCNDAETRPTDIGFAGSTARYPDRKRALGLLAASGIAVSHGGGQAEASLAVEDYGALFRRSKIVVNFARPVFDEPVFQCKGRVMEATLSGALLLEERNPETPAWLTPGKHYVEFTDERDLVKKAQYYLAHDSERAAVAAAGATEAHMRYSAAAYWRRVLDALRFAKATA